jgi:hypothetical protein
MAIAIPVVAHGTSNGQPLIEKFGASADVVGDLASVGWLSVIVMLGGAAGIVLCELQRMRAALVGLAITATAFSLGIFAVAAVRFDQYKPVPAIAEVIGRHADGHAQLAEFGYFQPSLVYYANSRVEVCSNLRRVIDFLNESTEAFVVTTAEHYGKLAARLPADVVVIDRRPDFPSSGSLVVLARKPAVAQRDSAKNQQ